MSDDEDTEIETDDRGNLICRMCRETYTIECGYEKTTHGYCWPCSSIKLEEILTAKLPPQERHLTPVVEAGGYVNACASLGCVQPDLARAYAGELLRAADAAQKR